jgi:Dehydrogenases with different specificities (related to short-chain alcohol dehydrogenases)
MAEMAESKRVHLITGASSAIGQAFIGALCSAGEEAVVIAQYNQTPVEEVRDRTGFRIIPIKADLGDPAHVEALISRIDDMGYAPDKIIHLAADKFAYQRFKQLEWQRVERAMSIQVHSVLQLMQHYLPMMAKQHYGRVVIMLSAYTLGMPPKFMSDYIIVKNALLGLMKAAAAEYAGKGVAVNGISPNMIETPFLSNIDERVIEMTAAESSLKRNITTLEVAKAIQFLLSDEAECMNGANLNLTGGDRA